MIEFIGNITWIIWMILLLTGYYLIQNEKVKPKDYSFIIINLIGSLFMIISLSIHFNLGSFILEIIFFSIGIKALYDKLKK